jgi:hypothetical protein
MTPCRNENIEFIRNRENIEGLRRSSGIATWFFGTYASKMNLKSFHACINCTFSNYKGSFCEKYCAIITQIEVCDKWIRKEKEGTWERQ